MHLTTTLLFYVLVGCGVAVAVYLALDAATGRERWFRLITAVLFWPLYLPALLQRPGGPDCRPGPASRWDAALQSDVQSGKPNQPTDEITLAIQQVEAELDLALHSLDGWSDAVLAREQHRFEELRAAWHAQAEKIHELDCLLAQPAFAEPTSGAGVPPAAKSGAGVSPAVPNGNSRQHHDADVERTDAPSRVATSERARRANIARLRSLRQRMHDDLLNTLAWVRELVTMIHLAKYTGAPASRAEELVMQIATSIEGLSEVAAWNEEDSARPSAATAPRLPTANGHPADKDELRSQSRRHRDATSIVR